MANEILYPYHGEQHQIAECIQAVWNLVARRPFGAYPTKSVLIIDEAQAMKPSVLESFRGLFDMGEKARMFGGEKPAFGMILVGNGTFLNRAGEQNKVAYEPLMQRFDITQEFGRPTRADYGLFVDGLPGLDVQIRKELVELGISKGSIRAAAKIWRSATRLPDGRMPSADHLQTISKIKEGV
ncbi:ATP-binding protein [Sedimentitalea sp. JM2-8]|uniref:ATP-binding protein n=2 Tax=Sedimentitalea xiamensis TaxID=3050037 RepID=A0ABT7FM42_9RHOB|nr:ATP-binding protein [Sedimentitalea xiamensis]MDK3075963.1 ATP-binding protein [Sedimentitalea xiamensis]